MPRFEHPHFSDESYKEILRAITSEGYEPLRLDEIAQTVSGNIHTIWGGGECYGYDPK